MVSSLSQLPATIVTGSISKTDIGSSRSFGASGATRGLARSAADCPVISDSTVGCSDRSESRLSIANC